MDRFLFMGEVVKTILNSLNKRKDNMDDRKRGWATKWSEEEDEVIRQYYPQNGWKKSSSNIAKQKQERYSVESI